MINVITTLSLSPEQTFNACSNRQDVNYPMFVFTESPEFEEPLCDIGADENKPLTLKVKILAVPEPEVTW